MEQNIKEIITIVLPIVSILISFCSLTVFSGHLEGLENTVSENIEKIGELGREMGIRRNITAELIAFERIRDNYKLYRHGISDEELGQAIEVPKFSVEKSGIKQKEETCQNLSEYDSCDQFECSYCGTFIEGLNLTKIIQMINIIMSIVLIIVRTADEELLIEVNLNERR